MKHHHQNLNLKSKSKPRIVVKKNSSLLGVQKNDFIPPITRTTTAFARLSQFQKMEERLRRVDTFESEESIKFHKFPTFNVWLRRIWVIQYIIPLQMVIRRKGWDRGGQIAFNDIIRDHILPYLDWDLYKSITCIKLWMGCYIMRDEYMIPQADPLDWRLYKVYSDFYRTLWDQFAVVAEYAVAGRNYLQVYSSLPYFRRIEKDKDDESKEVYIMQVDGSFKRVPGLVI
jgi:hypothetical protein